MVVVVVDGVSKNVVVVVVKLCVDLNFVDVVVDVVADDVVVDVGNFLNVVVVVVSRWTGGFAKA